MKHDRSDQSQATAGTETPPGSGLDAARAMAELSRQLAHPLRVTVLAHIANHGPCPFSELVEVSGASQAQVGNHLTLLRQAGLVATERRGRQSFYRLPNAYVAEALANLSAAVGFPADARGEGEPPSPTREEARGCYDHIGGRLGVAVLKTLLEREAVAGDPLGPDDLSDGREAATVLPAFGVPQWSELRKARRRFAYGCPDWTEKAPHLGGVLGAALANSFRDRQWINPRPGSRVLKLTSNGRDALRDMGVDV